MSSNYTGNPTATQAPGAQPAEGVYPTLALPTDGDPNAASTFTQSFKECADYIAWLMSYAGLNRLWGTGADETASYTTNASVTTPKQYTDCAITAGVTVSMFAPLQICGTLTMGDASYLSADGCVSGVGVDTGYANRNFLRGGTSGGTFGVTPVAFPLTTVTGTPDWRSAITMVAPGGDGGAGGSGDSGSGQAGAIWIAAGAGWTPSAAGILLAPPGFWAGPVHADGGGYGFAGLHPLAGGMGGGYGGAGTSGASGFGGAGGNVLWIAARHIVLTGAPGFTANGGAGAAGTGYGGCGGGGGGGVVILIYQTCNVSYATLLASHLWAIGGQHGGGSYQSGGAAGTVGKTILIQVPGVL